MTELRASKMTIHAGKTPLITDVSFTVTRGELVVLIGPNGAGKTTALRGAMGLCQLMQGEVTLDGQAVNDLPPQQRARRISYLPQSRPLAWPNRVKDIVALGRYAFGASASRLHKDDAAAVARAMDDCDITHLSERRADTLSGGEAARMQIARVFAAQSPLLIADEPVAALDPRHQFRIMDLIRDYVDAGNGALIVLHDLSLAARYADRIVGMKKGVIVADGATKTTLTSSFIRELYDVDAVVDGKNIRLTGPDQS